MTNAEAKAIVASIIADVIPDRLTEQEARLLTTVTASALQSADFAGAQRVKQEWIESICTPTGAATKGDTL